MLSSALLNRDDGLGGHKTVDKERFGLSLPNATPSAKGECHADDDTLLVLETIPVTGEFMGVGKRPGIRVPRVHATRVRKHSTDVEAVSEDAGPIGPFGPMVEEAKNQTVLERDPTHSGRLHPRWEPTIHAVTSLGTARKDLASPHVHSHSLLAFITAR